MAPQSRAAEQRAWRARNPEKVSEYNRRARDKNREWRAAYNRAYAPKARERHLLKKYGLTAAAWDALFASQGRRCAICRTTDPGKNGRSDKPNWHVDHAGPLPCSPAEVRGILCGFCNHAVGKGDRRAAVRLRRSMQYVEHFL